MIIKAQQIQASSNCNYIPKASSQQLRVKILPLDLHTAVNCICKTLPLNALASVDCLSIYFSPKWRACVTGLVNALSDPFTAFL